MPMNRQWVLRRRPRGLVTEEDLELVESPVPDLTDGQVLVLHDMLGLSLGGRVPKFVKNFMREHGDIPSAIAGYVKAVKATEFPAVEHGFSA